jgi:predicted nucleic acid-binding protein
MAAMSLCLLDTSVIIAQADEGLDVELPEKAAISVATLAELHYGVLAAKTEEARQDRLRRLGAIESLFEPIAIDAQVGRAFATVSWTVKTAGGQPRARVMDLWIAATALAHKLPLYTRNGEDFRLLHEILEVRIV